ncbi:hypothetical protein PCANC_19138 [Puccinia coronata f. sp. avenae]|uniref:DNA replication complex GINS protein PSF2 n=1 Tax=Puccinia coronata f. sp. avenae TaxID=200324 RepID=A0A2N5TSV2_9BASI|nr:hypothetical protein PCANC_19138 [Puccinia coronata f. sp. avenae]
MTEVYANQVNNLPLWLIIELKKRKMGEIIMPDWLSLPRLKENLLFEKKSVELSELPFYWIEMSKLLTELGPDDIEHLEETKGLLRDLKDIRTNKLRSSFKAILSSNKLGNCDNPLKHLKIPNISGFELSEMRPMITRINSNLQKLEKCGEDASHPPFGST